jgi:hypothetical protein
MRLMCAPCKAINCVAGHAADPILTPETDISSRRLDTRD